MKEFPLQFQSTKQILIHPVSQEKITGDILEIGPGRGDLLLTWAKENPKLKFVAIELGTKRYHKLVERVTKQKLENVTLIKADARVALKRFFEPETFQKIIVLFPDPWPKDRHAFRRLLSIQWIEVLTDLLKKNGELITATDVAEYAQYIFDNHSTFSNLKNLLDPNKWVDKLPELPETYFQRKWLDMGLNLHFMKHIKL
jgi:tRNA (guanine-N7-)-methyltransferase